MNETTPTPPPVPTNQPDEQEGVMRVLRKYHASTKNLQFDSGETYALQAAFDAAGIFRVGVVDQGQVTSLQGCSRSAVGSTPQVFGPGLGGGAFPRKRKFKM